MESVFVLRQGLRCMMKSISQTKQLNFPWHFFRMRNWLSLRRLVSSSAIKIACSEQRSIVHMLSPQRLKPSIKNALNYVLSLPDLIRCFSSSSAILVSIRRLNPFAQNSLFKRKFHYLLSFQYFDIFFLSLFDLIDLFKGR